MSDFNGLKRLKPYLYKRKIKILSILFLSIIIAFLQIIPIQIISIITNLISKSKMPHWQLYIVNKLDNSVANLIILFFLIYLAAELSDTIYGYIVSDLNNKIINEVREDAYSWILNNNKFNKQFKIGDIISRLTNDIECITRAVAGPLNGLLVSILTLIFSLIVFIMWDIKLALISLIGIPIIYFMSKWIAKQNHSITQNERKKIGEMSEYLSDVLTNFSLIKSYKTEDIEQESFNKINLDIYSYRKKLLKKFNVYWPAIHIVNVLGTSVIIYLAYLSIINGQLSSGDIIVAYTYISKIYRPIVLISRFRNDMSMADASITRIFNLKNLIDTEYNIPKYREKCGVKALPLKLEDVTIANDKNVVVNNINLKIEPGQLVTIIGESGNGKSSIINSLIGMNNIVKGNIFINNKNYTNDTAIRRELIRVCFQNPYIFKRSLNENINYGNDEKKKSILFKKACQDLGICELVKERGENFELTNLNTNLSGGEKKRLSICRTLNKYYPIYVFDEPTAELDTENRIKVKKILKFLKDKSTVIVVTHDKDIIEISDMILEVTNNRLKSIKN